MKTALDPRHQRRISLMQQLFSASFSDTQSKKDIEQILEHITLLDQKIQESAPEWPIEKIAKIDLAILRLSTYELLIEKKEPPKVVIDEAVELAKQFGNENTAKFVNGVLGTLFKSINGS